MVVSSTPSMNDIGVRMNPGAIAFAAMPYGASSTASDFVYAMMPPLAAL